MPKFPAQPRKITFGVERPVRPVIGSDGKPVHDTDGKALTEKVRMADGVLPDGSAQSFDFPEGHEHAGGFKGMAEILKQ